MTVSPELFVLSLGLLLAAGLGLAFKHLPREPWQILATVPLRKEADGRWVGLNLTYYGLFLAGAATAAVALFCLLLAALALPLSAILWLAGLILLGSIPAARGVAWLAEGKRNTFTVAGAAFAGLLLAPLAALATARLLAIPIPLLPVLAALTVAYLFGEGLGRLACISFGCCYGRPVDSLSGVARRLFARLNFTFSGPTRKIAYASGLEHVRVVPIQALTASLYSLAGLAGLWLFLRGRFAVALLVATLIAQLWRVASEVLRADYRGGRRISPYQLMGVGNLLYLGVLLLFLPSPPPLAVDLAAGLGVLWNPAVIGFLQLLFLLLFLYTGRSKVTGASLSFHVHWERI